MISIYLKIVLISAIAHITVGFPLNIQTTEPPLVPLKNKVDKIIENIRGLLEDFTHLLAANYKVVGNFFATERDHLMSNINETQQYFTTAVARKDEFIRQAKRAGNLTKENFLAKTLNLIDGWLQEVRVFQQTVMQSTEKELLNLKHNWADKMSKHWNEGLEQIRDVYQKLGIDKLTEGPKFERTNT